MGDGPQRGKRVPRDEDVIRGVAARGIRAKAKGRKARECLENSQCALQLVLRGWLG